MLFRLSSGYLPNITSLRASASLWSRDVYKGNEEFEPKNLSPSISSIETLPVGSPKRSYRKLSDRSDSMILNALRRMSGIRPPSGPIGGSSRDAANRAPTRG